MLHILMHSLNDTIPMLPFLFITYLLMELIEHKKPDLFKNILNKSKALGPFIGALLGVIPQCGFSLIASGLYLNQNITLGTLIAVFLSTSDEALPMLISTPENVEIILPLILIKIIWAMIVGYLIDYLVSKKFLKNYHSIHNIHDECDEEHHHSIIYLAFIHTIKVFAIIFVINFLLTFVMESFGEDNIRILFENFKILQLPIATLVGLIPNCAASVLLTSLYIDNFLSFGALVSGLMSSVGLGLLFLFQTYDNKRDIIRILLILVIASFSIGFMINLVGFNI